MKRTIILREWEPQTAQLTPEQASALAGLHKRLDVRRVGEDAWTLTSNGVVGAVRVKEVDVILRPRLEVGRVLWLVGYALRAPFVEHNAALAPDATLLDAFVEMYLRSLRRALRRGLHQAYRTLDDALMGVRGQLRIADQARRHLGLVVPAEVTYDDYTTDTDANRILKAALKRIGRMPIRDRDLRRRVAAATNAFATVSDVDFAPRSLPSVALTRLNAHYETPLCLAELVLRSGSVEISAGQIATPGLLFDMWRIFQDFLYAALAVHMPPGLTWKSQAKLSLDEDRRVRLQPDLSLWDGRRCIAVADAKYKRTDIGQDADLHQLLSYCIAADLPAGTLVYAEGPGAMVKHRVRHGGPTLNVVGLDLSARPALIDDACRQAARQLASSAESRSSVRPP